MTCTDLLIIFTDGSEKVITDVNDWGFNTEGGNFYFIKNNYRAFLPKENIKFFGRRFDYEM